MNVYKNPTCFSRWSVRTWKPTWNYEWEKTELEYFAGKLKAFDDNKYIIDLEKAENEITRWIVEADDWEEPYEIANELITEVLCENIFDEFEEFEDKEISKKDNSKHLLKICSKLLEALYNADNYIEYNNSLKTLFNNDEWEYLLEFPYSDLGAEINPRIEMYLYMLRKAKEQILDQKNM